MTANISYDRERVGKPELIASILMGTLNRSSRLHHQCRAPESFPGTESAIAVAKSECNDSIGAKQKIHRERAISENGSENRGTTHTKFLTWLAGFHISVSQRVDTQEQAGYI